VDFRGNEERSRRLIAVEYALDQKEPLLIKKVVYPPIY
jgi:hypothetical protein